MTKSRFDYFITLIVALPAVIIGAIAMSVNNIPSINFVLNIICLLTGWLVSCCVISKNSKIKKSGNYGKIRIVLILMLYVITFIDLGMDGVHRWLSLGPIRLYISSIFAPILIIELWALLKNNNELLVAVITIIVAILLVLQPDASQLTAFAIPMMIILFSKINNKILSCFIIGILISLIITSWIFLDSLPAVIYVEEIVGLVMGMGLIWSILGIISLIILPMPFLFLSKMNERILSKCLGLYFVILIITTSFGNFPVPLMGYGISPIIGYLMAITWLIKTK
ncbi:cell division protein [Cellulosilyticum sp. I15G10I2]|uniref:cell division protein n=1 Tax=Cellulosilyticum sp. I15G10I2 TaxID=1892843 RepID=UPI00085C66DD|nr:cell division protein [Cellulosilyticum sp. I15G10I2]